MKERRWRRKEPWESETDRLPSVRLCVSSEQACTRALFVLCCVIPLCAVDPPSLYSHPPINTTPVVDKAIWICSTPFSQVKVSSLVFGKFPLVFLGDFDGGIVRAYKEGVVWFRDQHRLTARYFKPTWYFCRLLSCDCYVPKQRDVWASRWHRSMSECNDDMKECAQRDSL